MTSPERLYSLCKAVEYITKNRIPGDIVECGVWRGGSMVAAALTLVALNETTRSLWLYDTFEGMTPPSDKDVRIIGGELADRLLAESSKDNRRSRNSVWCYAPLEEVQKNMADTAYPGPIHYIKGSVEKTIPESAPNLIAILRLDTDWYESTRHELVHLFPRLVPGGVLIIDDYGDWEGSRKAVDEYLEENGLPIFLSRIDSARLAIVPGRLATAPPI